MRVLCVVNFKARINKLEIWVRLGVFECPVEYFFNTQKTRANTTEEMDMDTDLWGWVANINKCMSMSPKGC